MILISVGGNKQKDFVQHIVVKKRVISLLVVNYNNIFTGPYETSQVVIRTLPSTASNKVNIIYSRCPFYSLKCQLFHTE